MTEFTAFAARETKHHREGKSLVYLKDQAFISKARIDGHGEVTVTQRHLVDCLTATLGTEFTAWAPRVACEDWPDSLRPAPETAQVLILDITGL